VVGRRIEELGRAGVADHHRPDRRVRLIGVGISGGIGVLRLHIPQRWHDAAAVGHGGQQFVDFWVDPRALQLCVVVITGLGVMLAICRTITGTLWLGIGFHGV
jgi:hypothetical protein